MKRILVILVLAVCVSLNVAAQDIRSKVASSSGTLLTNIIDPDKSIYGVEWGSSEDEFISRFGNPTGYIRLNGSETAMLYGKSHAFIFTALKLSGVRINSTVIDWKLSQALLPLTEFDRIKWQLTNGIRGEMNLAEVKLILGESLKTDGYQRYFISDRARVDLDFAHFPKEGEKDESYKVFGIYIRPASSVAAQKTTVSPRPPQSQIPQATQPCSPEVAKWWQEVRAAATEALAAIRRKAQALSNAWYQGQRHRRSSDDPDSVLPQHELDKLNADIATAREKFGRLLTEGQAKSHRAPIEDSRLVIMYAPQPLYTEEARKNKLTGTVKLQVEFRSDGVIGDVKVVSGLGDGLDAQAIKVARQTMFLPLVKDGIFVTTSKAVEADFHLR